MYCSSAFVVVSMAVKGYGRYLHVFIICTNEDGGSFRLSRSADSRSTAAVTRRLKRFFYFVPKEKKIALYLQYIGIKTATIISEYFVNLQ